MNKCQYHDGLEEKIDLIIERQMSYMQQQVALSKDVATVKGIVENGLKKTVEQLAQTAADFTQKAHLIDDFAWFIKIVNEFRTGLFKKVLKYAFVGALLALAYTFVIAYGNKAFPKLIEKLF